MTHRLTGNFYGRDVLDVAPGLLGKTLVRRFDNNIIKKYRITETEAYRGEEDLGCHACKGRTARTEVMYSQGGVVYVYLIYGMYWMLNIVTGKKDFPQAALIRGIEDITGPGRVAGELMIDKSFYSENLVTSNRMWIEDAKQKTEYYTGTRVGIDYAGEIWKNKPWRYTLRKEY